jgi:hypothetical protein
MLHTIVKTFQNLYVNDQAYLLFFILIVDTPEFGIIPFMNMCI